MINLFDGIGPQGEMRFIGEVERGAACGCRCPECNSPLIAKQGNEKEWHFAHEGGRERPECHAGAMNMLRRLAIEHLATRGPVAAAVSNQGTVRSTGHRKSGGATIDGAATVFCATCGVTLMSRHALTKPFVS